MSNEAKKTIIFAVAAVVIGTTGLALQARRSTTRTEISKEVGKPLFPKLTTTDEVASLEIIEVNEDLADMRTFKLAQKGENGLWQIPSESDYPADAADQVRDAATMFIGLETEAVVSQLAEDHEELGVIEPTEENKGKKGVGKLVILQDAKNEDLARLIIGKEVKGEPEKRFVRRTNQDVVFVAELDASKLSTRFADWIKKDLLDVAAFDIEDVDLKDYSVVDVQDGQFIRKILSPRMEASLHYDSDASKWILEELLTYNDEGEKVPSPLGEDEELDTQKLNDLKYAVDDLEIVAVFPKPEGLGADLKAGEEFMADRENQESLAERGFFPQKLEDGSYDVKAANGEAHVTTNDGIKYVLRFGEISIGDGLEEGKINRYLFVSTQVDESKFPLPVKEQLPGQAGPSLEPPQSTPPSEESGSTPPSEQAPPSEEASDDTPPSEEPSEEPAADSCDDEPPAAQEDDPPADPAEPKQDEPKQDEPKQEDAAADDTAPSDDVPVDPSEFDSLKDQGLPNRIDETVREAEMQRIEKEYQRQIDEREENLKQARARVAELNARFADWYYVVSEDTYQKIHLGRSDIVKKKSEEGDAATPPLGAPGGLPGLNFPGQP